MLRRLLGTGLLLATLAGCTELDDKDRTCTSDSDCGGGTSRCELSVGLCYQGGTESETDTCDPVCASYDVCTTAGCQARFKSLTIQSPANNAVVGGGTVQVQAKLEINLTYASTTQYPDTLVFKASRNDGGESGSFGIVTRNGDTYTVDWTPPAAQVQVVLTAEHPTPGAVKSPPVTVQVDTLPPELSISFSAPPTRAPGTIAQADQQDPTPGYTGAFRRDEPVTVLVAANELVNNLLLTVVGIGPNATPGQAQAPVAVQPGGTCPGSPVFCGSVTVDLSLLEMRDVRGTMVFNVEGVDAVGNKGTATAGLKVTRWKWAYEAGGAINSTPAVGSRGTVYFGTDETSGKMFAIGPDGASKWSAALALGQIGASPAVGALNGTEEYVYVSAKGGSGTFFYALQGSDGAEKAKCTLAGSNEVESSIAVGTTSLTLGTAETGIAVYNGSQVKIVGLRPDAPIVTDSKCIELSGTGPTAFPASVPGSSVVMKDQKVFYAAAGPKLTCYDFATGSNSPCSGWPLNTNSLARGLAIVDDKLYGGAANTDDPTLGSLFSSLLSNPSGGAVSFVYPNSNTSRVFSLAVGSGKIGYFGAENASGGELLALLLDVGGATPSRATDTGTLRGAPAFGKNDRLYTLNTQGRLAGWTASSLARQWETDLPTIPGQVDVSPTLDCRRDASGQAVAGLGTLYAASGTRLYALVVDSAGLDPDAPWPKFQHDARNTGNPATTITNCP